MAPLRNARHEKFALAKVKGMSHVDAYQFPGYNRDRHSASKLATNHNIRKRIDELFARQLLDVRIDRDRLSDWYLDQYQVAVTKGNENTARAILDSLAKLHGLMINRQESGKAGDFANLSDHELIELIAEPLGEAEADDGEGIR